VARVCYLKEDHACCRCLARCLVHSPRACPGKCGRGTRLNDNRCPSKWLDFSFLAVEQFDSFRVRCRSLYCRQRGGGVEYRRRISWPSAQILVMNTNGAYQLTAAPTMPDSFMRVKQCRLTKNEQGMQQDEFGHLRSYRDCVAFRRYPYVALRLRDL
jgi:hypothetical protein